jgi:H+/Cl- antiporter ClcA
MQKIRFSFTQFNIAVHLLKWTLLVVPVAIVTGSLVALFLWLLDLVTVARWNNEWLLFLLPLAGIGIHFLYKYAGKNAEAGNNLIMDEIHEPGGGVPARMTPLVLVTTLITHLFGGSAGREGTAVQMGGSIAGLMGRWFKLTRQDVSIILMAGIAAGFGAVFGTPISGAVFALEVIAIGTIRYNALLPCLIASIVADITCTAWGIHHTHYSVSFIRTATFQIPFIDFDFLLLGKVVVCGILFGLVSYLFSSLQHSIKSVSNRFIPVKWMIPFAGGLMVIGLCYIVGTRDYIGLGVVSNSPMGVSITSSFKEGGATYLSWLWKLLFTAITLGTGFKGGEVTPLFFIGATLGNALAIISGSPVDLFAALGFIAVFAGATNTPLACTIMGVELFGGANVIYFAVACFTAYYFSGNASIYSAQRMGVIKGGGSMNRNG